MLRFLTATLASVIFIGCQGKGNFGGFPPQKVVVQPLSKRPVIKTFSTTCEVFKGSVFKISFPVSGVISYLNPNNKIKKGETLAELRLEDIVGQLESTKRELELQKSILDRYKKLREVGGVSEIELQTQDKLVFSLNEKLVELDKTLQDRRIPAPADGLLGPWQKKIGETVTPAEQIGSFKSEGETFFDCFFPSGYMSIFESKFKAFLGDTELRLVSKGVDTNKNDMFSVRLAGALDMQDGSLIQIRFTAFSNERRFIVPIEAIKFDFGGSKVFLISEKDGKFFATQKVITINEILNDAVVIDGSLEEGMLVVVRGVPKLFEGAMVEFSEPVG